MPRPSLHQKLDVSSTAFLVTAGACLAISLLILLVTWLLWSKPSTKRASKPLVTVEAAAHAKDRVAVLLRRSRADTALAKHCRRLLLERGFAEVREVSVPGELDAACRGAHLAVDFAFEAPDATAAWGTAALLRACDAHGVRAIVQCTDALVGYDASADVCDGDELSDPGLSLITPEPRAPPPASARLADLAEAEAALARHAAAPDGACDGALVLRLTRLYHPDEAAAIPALPALLLGCGVGVGLGGLRGQTSLLHAEDAALGLCLAADKLLQPEGALRGAHTVVLADGAVWSAAHLLRCAARALRLPPPLLPLPLPSRWLLGRELGALAATHCYFTGLKAGSLLGFAPQAGDQGLHAAFTAAAARAPPPLRVAPALLLLALFLGCDALGAPPAAAAAALAAAAGALVCALLPPPAALPAQPPLPPPLVAGGMPLLGHLLSFIKGPVSPPNPIVTNPAPDPHPGPRPTPHPKPGPD